MSNLWWRLVRVRRLTEMSSRTAAWGQPPVSTATIRSLVLLAYVLPINQNMYSYAGRALCLVRNSPSSRVKMSLVTAATLKRSRSFLHRASIRAVFPEPTGLRVISILTTDMHNITLTLQCL